MSIVLVDRRKGRKFKQKAASSSLQHVFVDDWSDEWVEVADRLCDVLKLPDLTTRSGLKRIHADISNIQKRLHETYKQARRYNHNAIMGGLISIYTKMCTTDSILQDKLIDGGLFDKIISLAEVPEARNLALRALNALTMSAGKRLTTEFMHNTPNLLRLMKRHSDDLTTTALVVGMYTHCSIYMANFRLFPELPVLANTVLDALRNPDMSDWTYTHALAFLSNIVNKAGRVCKDIPSITTLFVALLRSNDLRRRFQAVSTLFELASTPENPEHNSRQPFAPFTVVGALQNRTFPDDLSTVMDVYGRDQCQTSTIKRSKDNYISILSQHADAVNPDYVKLGRALGSEVIGAQFAVADMMCSCCAGPVGGQNNEHWKDIALKCASALRAAAAPGDAELADALEWKVLFMEGVKPATEFAKKALVRHPHSAFFHNALAEHSREEDALRLAKKGLKIEGAPAWIRQSLLHDAATKALYRSLRTNLGLCPDERVALLHSSLEDARALVREIPPDSLQFQGAVSIHVILCFLVGGRACGLTSPEVKTSLDAMTINERFLEFLGHPITNRTQMRKTCTIITNNMDAAMTEWGGMLSRSKVLMEDPESYSHTFVSLEDRESSDLQFWLNKFEGDIEGPDRHETASTKNSEDMSTPLSSDLPTHKKMTLTCSWCRRPSAILKKCGGCGLAKYCDTECQRKHWKHDHKELCGKPDLEAVAQAPSIVVGTRL
ncbi:hypothetical protein OF83DRAFT_1118664 [Amylostereum chailletii]|nr:hypothetical protein OF83DRAFT_1118664 [Amylostereum chailletii]